MVPLGVPETDKDAPRRAVVDIGSNSVRLVIYGGSPRAPIPICNEKALCGLGRDLTPDGALNPAAEEDALSTLKRFRLLLDEHGSPPVHTIATAAVREARDGKAFMKKVKALGFGVKIISGAEEAALTAMGVVSFEPGATGLVGDMGGGSLELVGLQGGAMLESASLSVGPLRLMQETKGNVAASAPIAEQAITGLDWLTHGRFDTLYSVGGAWRAVARIHMRVKSYPLTVLHNYELSSMDAVEICNLIARQSRRSLEDIPHIPRQRIDTLPYAAVVLRSLLKHTGVKRVIVSAAGLREGLLYKDLSKDERAEDPLLAACRFYAERLAPGSAFGPATMAAADPLFAGEGREERRLREAISLLVDIGAFFHPDQRALHAFETVLRAPFAGLSHRERVIAALALYRRHGGGRASLPSEKAIALLSPEDQQYAARLGLTLRFLAAFAPKAEARLRNASLCLDDGQLIFSAPANCRALMTEFPRKRLASLAEAFGATPEAQFEG